MEYMMNPYRREEASKCARRNIKVNGKGQVEAQPDMAVVSLGVVTKDKNPQIAQNTNNEISQKMINALLRLGISKEDIKTSSYTVFPDYDFIEGKQILTGYTVSNIYEIKVRDIKMVGEVINTSVQNGANQINSVNFTLEDSAYYYNSALKLAVRDAASKAQAIANTMKVSLNPIPCSVTEQSTSFTPFTEQQTMKLAAADVVMPGKLQITAVVEAEFEYWT